MSTGPQNSTREKKNNSVLIDKLLTNARFYLEQKSFQHAIETYREALEIDPGNKEARRGLKQAQQENTESANKPSQISIPQQSYFQAFQTFLLNRKLSLSFAVALLIIVIIIRGQISPVEKSSLPIDKVSGSLALKEAITESNRARELAESSQASVYAPDIYESARQKEARAKQAHTGNQFNVAESLYHVVRDEYIQAEQRALKILENLKNEVSIAREKAQSSQGEAAHRGADDLPFFKQGVAQLKEGEQELNNGNYAKAQSAFAKAEQSFNRAAREALQLKTEQERKRILMAEANTAERNVMNARQYAEEHNAKEYAVEAFDYAAKKEGEGRRFIVEENYSEAVKAFNLAEMNYLRALNEMKAVAGADDFYKKGQYENSIEALTAVLADGLYQDENSRARGLLQKAEEAISFREKMLAASRKSANVSDLETAIGILGTLPERDSIIVKKMTREILAMDHTPPQILHSPDKEYEPKKPIIIKAMVQDNLKVDKVLFGYRKKGEKEYKVVEMKPVDEQVYEFSIQPEEHKDKEIEYYLAALDISRNQQILGSREEPLKIQVKQTALHFH